MKFEVRVKKKVNTVENVFDQKLLYEIEPFLIKYIKLIDKDKLPKIKMIPLRPVEIRYPITKRLHGIYKVLDILLFRKFGWKVLSEGVQLDPEGNYYFIPMGEEVDGVSINFSNKELEKAKPEKPSRSLWESWGKKPLRLKLLYKSPSKYLKPVKKEKVENYYLEWIHNLEVLVNKCEPASTFDGNVYFRCDRYLCIKCGYLPKSDICRFLKKYFDRISSREEQVRRRAMELLDPTFIRMDDGYPENS